MARTFQSDQPTLLYSDLSCAVDPIGHDLRLRTWRLPLANALLTAASRARSLSCGPSCPRLAAVGCSLLSSRL